MDVMPFVSLGLTLFGFGGYALLLKVAWDEDKKREFDEKRERGV